MKQTHCHIPQYFLSIAFRALCISCALSLLACSRTISSPEDAMRQTSPQVLTEDLSRETLITALTEQIRYFQHSKTRSDLIFGPRRTSRAQYLQGLINLRHLAQSNLSDRQFLAAVKEKYDFFEVFGRKSWGEVLVTSYYEPIIPGSRTRTSRFSRALYRKPTDLLIRPKSEQSRIRISEGTERPYFTREEIDTFHALDGRGLEICWVDPLDAFFLQTQGSGTIEFEDHTTLRLAFSEKNGHRYEAIGNFLKADGLIENVSLQAIEKTLRRLSPDRQQFYLNRNPSYVFFRESQQNAITSLGIPATAGRTIATDGKLFPKGAVAFLVFDKPIFPDENSLIPDEFRQVGRIVIDQDVGSAILGGGRVDLFWGRGNDAKRSAGAVRSEGRLYYLVPKMNEENSES